MSNKYSARSLPSVSRDDSFIEQSDNRVPSWYNDFISNLEKNSTQSQKSIYDEINSIMGYQKSKFSNVEEIVNDLKERTGLKAFLDAKQIIASTKEPEIFNKVPEMKVFIDNFVADRPGTSIESVVHDILRIDTIRDLLPERTDVDDDVKSYINTRIMESRQFSDINKVDMHIGKVDHSAPSVSDDPLAICEPYNKSM